MQPRLRSLVRLPGVLRSLSFAQFGTPLGTLTRMAQRWLVSFKAGPMTDELRGAITASGFTLTGGHGEATAVPPGGQLAEITNHTVLLEAPSEQDAREQVQRALEPHAPVVNVSAARAASD
jgi:hypothetical protein